MTTVEETDDHRTAAAIMAAVQAYLEQEAHLAEPESGGRISRWKLALRQPQSAPARGIHGSWSGRDRSAGPSR